jgi:hypothetical protein
LPYQIPLKLRWTQFLNRRSVRSKLEKLLRQFPFITAEKACTLLDGKLEVALDLGQRPLAYES